MELTKLQSGDIGFIYKPSNIITRPRGKSKEELCGAFIYIGVKKFITINKGKVKVDSLDSIKNERIEIRRREEMSDQNRSLILSRVQSLVLAKKSPKNIEELIADSYEYAMKPLFSNEENLSLEKILKSNKLFPVN